MAGSPTAPGDGWSESVPDGSTYELNVSVEFPPPPARPGEAGADWLVGGSGSATAAIRAPNAVDGATTIAVLR